MMLSKIQGPPPHQAHPGQRRCTGGDSSGGCWKSDRGARELHPDSMGRRRTNLQTLLSASRQTPAASRGLANCQPSVASTPSTRNQLNLFQQGALQEPRGPQRVRRPQHGVGVNGSDALRCSRRWPRRIMDLRFGPTRQPSITFTTAIRDVIRGDKSSRRWCWRERQVGAGLNFAHLQGPVLAQKWGVPR